MLQGVSITMQVKRLTKGGLMSDDTKAVEETPQGSSQAGRHEGSRERSPPGLSEGELRLGSQKPHANEAVVKGTPLRPWRVEMLPSKALGPRRPIFRRRTAAVDTGHCSGSHHRREAASAVFGDAGCLPFPEMGRRLGLSSQSWMELRPPLSLRACVWCDVSFVKVSWNLGVQPASVAWRRSLLPL